MTASVDPSKVKLPLSSSSPAVPTITIRLSVRSLTFTDPALTVSKLAVPSICKSLNSNPLAPKLDPASDAGSIFPVTVIPAPTIRPLLAVTIPANAALPVEP